MKTFARVLLAALALGYWFLFAVEPGSAGDKKKTITGVLKIADLIEKNDLDGAKKAAAALARDKDVELGDLMLLFKLRADGGCGIGNKAGTIKPDGIESWLIQAEKKAPQQKSLEDQGKDLARSAYISAAVADVILSKCPVPKKVKDKDPAEWKKWTDDMRKLSQEMAEAVKAKKPGDVKTVARKLNDSCRACHSPFRPD